MLCCAVAAFIFSQIYGVYLMIREKLHWEKPVLASVAASWTLGDAQEASAVPRNRSFRMKLTGAFAVGATALLVIVVVQEQPRNWQDAIQYCGQIIPARAIP